MEIWFIVFISLSIVTLFNLLFSKKSKPTLPPSPFSFPIIGNFTLLRKSPSQMESFVRSLNSKLGPVITLQFFGTSPAIIISDRSLAHQSLIQNGAVFSDRPSSTTITRVTSNQRTITSASYGPTWRLLRRNLMPEILHPTRVKSYSNARKWVLQILVDILNSHYKSGDPVRLHDHFQYAMFCLLVLMCFGDKVDEKTIEKVKEADHHLLHNLSRFHILNFLPKLTKILFRKRWEEFLKMYGEKYDVLMPLIKERRKLKEERINNAKQVNDEYVLAYVDTLFDLELPEEKRKLNDIEISNLCSEFLVAGTDTTSTALQWVMANLVKYPRIQEKLFTEIKGVVGDEETEVKEDELQKMPYLKAVILEGLRRHPPAHFLLTHAVSEDTVLNGFFIPKKASVNVMVADIGWDPKVWEDPMEFKPERFLNNEQAFDITGSKEIKMMPFGVGRRICPGIGLAMLKLEYFVANLIWWYEWKAVDGDEVNLEEKREVLTVAMKNPLQAHISPRTK
ncbi:cytochrome P450 89A2-like [Pistacia vera]|uniref:cytochrome P450 89A2-like n=1 Tax=Pistacia vera TaxID=55513 RepID=UPI0012630FD9|nr:cytochrome P450 89A2-like [Pistacia vera]